MKKRFYLLIAIALAAILTGGTYAFTFQNATASIGVTAATSDFATVTTASGQPDWNVVLPVDAAETLRPNAAGDQTLINLQYPASGLHWEKVDEVVSDSDTTYVATSGYTWEEDLYQITNHATGTGSISYVKVYIVVRTTGTPTQASAYAHIKTNGTEYDGSQLTLTTGYAAYSYQWNNNPMTGAPWTWSEIDALQVGAGIRQGTGGGPVGNRYTRVTQVYTEVGYRSVGTRGEVPTGNLFTITPKAGYTGDIIIKVYIANTDALSKAYQYLNMKLYLLGSEEAGQTPNYQLLTLDNGTASFHRYNLPGVEVSRNISIIGGGYGLHTIDSMDWEPGWSVTPEFFIEIENS